MEDSHQEDDGLLDPPISHRVTLDSHWAMPSSRLGHASHHHGGSSSRNVSRPGSSATRCAVHGIKGDCNGVTIVGQGEILVERERECVCVCVCVSERERERAELIE